MLNKMYSLRSVSGKMALYINSDWKLLRAIHNIYINKTNTTDFYKISA